MSFCCDCFSSIFIETRPTDQIFSFSVFISKNEIQVQIWCRDIKAGTIFSKFSCYQLLYWTFFSADLKKPKSSFAALKVLYIGQHAYVLSPLVWESEAGMPWIENRGSLLYLTAVFSIHASFLVCFLLTSLPHFLSSYFFVWVIPSLFLTSCFILTSNLLTHLIVFLLPACVFCFLLLPPLWFTACLLFVFLFIRSLLVPCLFMVPSPCLMSVCIPVLCALQFLMFNIFFRHHFSKVLLSAFSLTLNLIEDEKKSYCSDCLTRVFYLVPSLDRL